MLDVRIDDITGESPRSLGFAYIARAASAALADYRAMVYDSAGCELRSGEVKRYARWSAPVHDLMLRGLCSAFCGAERIVPRKLRGDPMPRSTLVALAVWPGSPQTEARHLMTWRIDRHGTRVVYLVTDSEGQTTRTKQALQLCTEKAIVWEVILRVRAEDLYGVQQVGQRFPPLGVPLHGEAGANYVRIRDIPAHVRPAFERHTSGRGRPRVEGVADAVFPRDWTDFLAGGEP
jgi:hypothetical protein